MPDGGSVLARYTCESCGRPFVPRSKRHTRTCGNRHCRDGVAYRDSRRSLHLIVGDQERSRRWHVENGGYWLARISLAKRGLLTYELQAQIETLKGKGPMTTADALRACGLQSKLSARAAGAVSLRAAGPSPRTGRTQFVASVERPPAWSIDSPTFEGTLVHGASLVFARRGETVRRVHDYVGARFLHGALHRHLDVGHSMDETAFSLVLPTKPREALWLITADATLIDRLPTRVLLATDDGPHELSVQARSRFRSPPARHAGQYRVTIEAKGPLVIKAVRGGKPWQAAALQTNPTELVGSLERVAKRMGLQIDPNHIHAKVLSHSLVALPDGIRVGGHWGSGGERGVIHCMLGSIELECNAVARWLLDCAAIVGLGSATALGFGRITVRDA